jgi:hypothetical protein
VIGGPCGIQGSQEKSYRLLLGKSERKRPLGICTRRWEDNIKMSPKEMGWKLIH